MIIIISHGLSAINDSIYNLMVLRFGMGIGLGVILVSLNVMVSEFSNDKNRSFAIAMLHSGFSVGMMLGGGLAALVLEPLGWRYVFWLGVLINTSLLFLLIFFLMESPTFLITRQPRNALARLNTMLKQLGHQALEAMPLKPSAAANGGGGFKAMLEGRMASASIMLWAASLTYAVVGYFLLNWKPSVLVDAGLTPTQASLGGVFEGFLGIAGHLIVGLLARKGAEARVTAAFFAMLGVFLVIFGNITAEWWVMIGISGMLKFFTVGAYTGIFLVVIAMYEPAVRSMGLGFMVGFGRVGAIIGPLIGGLLIGADIGRPATFAVFAVVAVVPAVLMVLVGRQNAARQAPLKEAAA
ncbi:MAG: MFS transporter [Terricaulis sp.]|nr:MFS transporter [Terricaulis sp.]